MKKITAAQVKKLRDKTGAPMLEAKAALLEAGGDQGRAEEILRKKGQIKAGKKAEHLTGEGRIDAYIHGEGRLGVLLEVACETDFVARNQEFGSLVHDLALQVAASAPCYVSRQEVPKQVVAKEKQIYAEQARLEGKRGQILEKIVNGRLEKFYQETCLLEQPFVKDPDITVRELITGKIAVIGENIQVRRFVRYVLGEE